MKRVITAALTGASLALSPLVALAAEPVAQAGSRVVGQPAGVGLVQLFTTLGLGGLFLVLGLGYLYRRERGLDWEFQAPAVPHDDHHDSHAPAAASASAPHGASGH